MTGANPNTGWLKGCVVLDNKGFIKTGPDLSPEELTGAHWPLTRRPYLLETSMPGIFAAGDVRGGNVKRVASAVGEGSSAISFVHKTLGEYPAVFSGPRLEIFTAPGRQAVEYFKKPCVAFAGCAAKATCCRRVTKISKTSKPCKVNE